MRAIILSIGDELVLGQTVDTNSAWISQQLAGIGCGVVAHLTVGDDQPAIERAIRDSAGRCDVLLISGGIGPTEDDLTRQSLAAVLAAPLEPSALWMERLETFFKARGRPMPESNRIQAMIPRGATLIENTNGTAAGIRVTLPHAGAKRSDAPDPEAFVMPGVPKEMKAMFTRDVLPHLAKATGGAAIVSRTLHTFGLGESWVAEKLGDLMTRGRNPSVGTTVANGIVSLRVNSRFDNRSTAKRELDQTVHGCHEALGDMIFGSDEQTLQSGVVKELINETPSPTIAVAESCTGGLLAKMFTDIPGSSEVFKQGWITYSNEAKTRELGVQPATLESHGAVSVEVAREMAEGALRESGADFALAITGIAGPGGGTALKPVGMVCIALATRESGEAGVNVDARAFNFPGDREMVRDRSAKMALSMLRYHLLGKPMPF